jgi:CheY-like chemotaxis protein
MDLRMPVMDGRKSTAQIRLFEQDENLPDRCLIIAMTASDFDDDIQSCLDEGMDTYIGKPFMVSKFMKILSERFNPLP